MKAASGLVVLFLLLCSHSLLAQTYFQQQVDYRIGVALDDIAHSLAGDIEMDYTNHSFNALDTIFIHLWPNAYSSRNTDLGEKLRRAGQVKLEFSKPEERGNIIGLDFSIDDKQVTHHTYKEEVDIAYILLPEPLQPGGSLTIKTPFYVKIPIGKFSRLGHIGQSYQISQWYPKPAVYDKEGWHPLTYLSQGEFYSEFGSFDVSITLPSNYVVGATGQLQNVEELDFLRQRAHETVSRPAGTKLSNDFPPSSTETKTIRYTQDNVHDFAWFADKRFNILHQPFNLEGSDKLVEGWVYFTNNYPEAWSKSMEYVVDATKHYSTLVGDYPYDHVSVVDGTLSAGGGMEYPMITVVNGTSNDHALEQVVVHEIGHNWFYGILGSNEREHAWMDEGINSYYEIRYFAEKYPPKEEGKGQLLNYLSGSGNNTQELAYRYSACRHQDQALSTSSADFSALNYGVMVYMKGAKIMDHLSSVLGEEEFDRVMHAYYEEWEFRHPGPADMQASLEKASGQSLAWFFEDLARDNVKINHKICCLDKSESSVKVKSRTSYEGPVAVGFMKEGEVVDLRIGSGSSFEVKSEKDFDAVLIDPEQKSLQLNRRNDGIRTKGILKTWQLPEPRFAIGSGMSEQSKVYWAPAFGWNEQDRFMLGGYLSNAELLFKDFEWTLVPMYSSDRGRLIGMAHARKTFWMSETGPGRLDVSLGAKQFSLQEFNESDAHYTALESKLVYEYQDPSKYNGKHSVSFELNQISFNTGWDTDASTALLKDREDTYAELRYDFVKDVGLTSNLIGVSIEGHEDYLKATLEAGFAQKYDLNENSFRLRAYVGVMTVNEDTELIPLGARLNLNGTSGLHELDYTSDDYRFEHLFINRSEVQASRPSQIVRDRGGFVQSSPWGSSDEFVASLGAEFDLPIPFPLSIYGSIGVFGKDPDVLYETGARITLIKDICDISFPITNSPDTRNYYDYRDIKYIETIRIQLRLELLSIRNLVDNINI